MSAQAIERGCGFRQQGGVYAEVPLSDFGLPLENFLFCPPITHVKNNQGERAPIEQAWGLSPRGVTLIHQDGAVHVVDIVGRQSYPNASDILEETRRHGLSRRLELSEEDYALLGPGSKILLAHAWGSKANASDYALDEPPTASPCPKAHPYHERNVLTEMCAALHLEGIVGGETYDEEKARAVRRTVGSTSYFGYSAPTGIDPTRNEMALIAAFPIHHITVVRHDDKEVENRAVERASKTAFDLSLEDF